MRCLRDKMERTEKGGPSIEVRWHFMGRGKPYEVF